MQVRLHKVPRVLEFSEREGKVWLPVHVGREEMELLSNRYGPSIWDMKRGLEIDDYTL